MMDNELISDTSWWRKNWKWLLPSSAFALIFFAYIISVILGFNTEPQNHMEFDKTKWSSKKDSDYVYRKAMLKDLMRSDKIKKLNKEEVIDLLGKPDRIDSAYLFYRIAQQRIGLFPLHTKTMVIKLSNDSLGNKVMIHE